MTATFILYAWTDLQNIQIGFSIYVNIARSLSLCIATFWSGSSLHINTAGTKLSNASVNAQLMSIKSWKCTTWYSPLLAAVAPKVSFLHCMARQGRNVRNHYENTPIQIYWKFYNQKLANFQIKNSNIFHISAQNIDCGYSLESPQRICYAVWSESSLAAYWIAENAKSFFLWTKKTDQTTRMRRLIWVFIKSTCQKAHMVN